MFAMTLASSGWDLRNIAKNDQGKANCELFQFFRKLSLTVVTIRTKRSTFILNHIEVLSETPYESNEIFYSHLTLYGDLCVQ